MTPARDRHFVSVWNPSYADDAMESHLEILMRLAAAYEAGDIGDDELYVWWGKVRSGNRQTQQTHLDEARDVAKELADSTRGETQLYLTDYRSLYVAEVDAIHFGDLPTGAEGHVPAYYARERLACDYWFRLLDVRRLVADDLPGVIRELQCLRNVHYHDRPVSLYGGMVDLPLFVTRPDGRTFFDPDERDTLTGGRLWAELDAELGSGVAAIERDLRENMFGEKAWLALDATTRTFIATGEKLFREHRNDGGFDFAPVIGSFAKALEVQANLVLRTAASRLPPALRMTNIEGATRDLSSAHSLSLGQLARAIGGERTLNERLRSTLANGDWFAGSLPAILEEFRELRNPGVHQTRVGKREAARWRDRLLGVGCVGDFIELARVQRRSGHSS